MADQPTTDTTTTDQAAAAQTPPATPAPAPTPPPPAPVAPAPAPTPAPAQAAVAQSTAATIVGMTKNLFDDYTTVMGQKIVKLRDLVRGAKILSLITNRVLTNPTDDHLDALYEFHTKNSTGLMAEQNGLRGINTLNRQAGERAATLYTVFRWKVKGATAKIDDATTAKILGTPKVMQYLRRKK